MLDRAKPSVPTSPSRNGFRWTAGDAAAPSRALLPFEGPRTVALHVGCTALYSLEQAAELRRIA